MHKLFTATLFLLSGAMAGAHTLAEDAGLPQRLGHQLLGLHHLPFTLLLVAGGVYLLRRSRRRERPDGKPAP